jgi:hypothetical protein
VVTVNNSVVMRPLSQQNPLSVPAAALAVVRPATWTLNDCAGLSVQKPLIFVWTMINSS